MEAKELANRVVACGISRDIINYSFWHHEGVAERFINDGRVVLAMMEKVLHHEDRNKWQELLRIMHWLLPSDKESGPLILDVCCTLLEEGK